jgi:subtilisin family serine protease
MERRGAFRNGVARAFAVSLAATLATLAATSLGAARLDAEFVALLTRPGARRHPLADASGRLPLVIELTPGVDARALGWLPLSPELATVRVAPPELPSFLAAHPGAHFSIWPPLHPVLDVASRRNGVPAYRAALAAAGAPVAGTGEGVVVGIVDTGIDATHPDLRDAMGHTRIAWLLDFSRPPSGRHPELEDAFGCTAPDQSQCNVLDQADIDGALAGDPSVVLPGDPVGHGTHVTSIAAGNGGTEARYVGAAPAATLVIASVDHGDASGALADVDIVTATRFIFDRAGQMGLPAVANLSLGGDFGPHDGTTPIEVSLAALVGSSYPGRSIVVAAGNSGALYRGDLDGQVLGIHTESRVTAGAAARLRVLTPDARADSKISGSVYVWLTYRAADTVSVGLQGPNGLSIHPVGVGQKAGFRASDDKLSAAVYNGVFEGTPLPALSHGAVLVWEGEWPAASETTIELEGEGFVEAWLDTKFDDASSSGPAYFDVASRAGTINVPGSHPDLIAVGCTNNRATWVDSDGHPHDLAVTAYRALAPEDGSCYFSSAGPNAKGAAKPDISAPGAMVAAAMAADAVPGLTSPSAFAAPHGLCPDGNECLVVDAGHALLSGSSMSSPQVAGAVALLFERSPGLTQSEILRLLQGGVRRPLGPITADYQLGAGALDVLGAMAGLDALRSNIVRDPDAAASWLSLAQGYVHPGGGSDLVGTVAVRAADGSLADGFDEGRLTLAVGNGGSIKAPLRRESAGLYRFAVGAEVGTGSRVVSLDVAIDGVSIGVPGSSLAGHRLLPVGADRWIASGSTRVYGGCGVGRRARPEGRSGAAWFSWTVALAGIMFVARRAAEDRLPRDGAATPRRANRRSRHRTPRGTPMPR